MVTQISTWKSRAIEAIGVSSTIGVAVGGAVAAAAGVAASFTQGAVRGIVETSTSSQATLLPPPAALALQDSTDSHVPVQLQSTSDANALEVKPEGGHCLILVTCDR